MRKLHPFRPMRSVFGGLSMALSDARVRLLLALTFTLILGASVFYSFVEGWGMVDSIYFATVTLATVGYGDFTPQTVPGKLFTVGYVLIGIGVFVAAATAVADHLVQRGRHLERQAMKREQAAKERND